MRLLRLASVVLAVCSSPALAAPGDSLPNNRPELAEARGDWRAVNEAPRLLKLGLYGAPEHRATASAIESLPAKLRAANVPPERVAKVQSAATAAGRREAEFWAGLSLAQQAGRAPASPEALARVVAPLEALRAELTPLFLGTESAALGPGALPPPSRPELEEARRSQTVQGNVDHSVSRVRSAGGASGEDGARFWDLNTRRGDADAGVNATGLRGTPQAPAPTQPILAGIGPFAGLQTQAVPNPTRQAAAARVAPTALPTRQLRDAAGASLHQAVTAATRTGLPVRANAESLAGPAGRGPQAPVRVGVSPEEAQQAAQPGPSPCEQVLSDAPDMIRSTCKNHPNLALLWGGLYAAVIEQFGSLQAIGMNLLFMLIGLLLSALSGFGVIAKIVIGAGSLIFMAATLGPMLKQGWDAFWKWKGSQAGTMDNASSLFTVGKVGSSVLIMALMAALGYKFGKTATGARVNSSMQSSMTAMLTKMKVGAGVAAADSLLPAGVRSTLQSKLGVAAPADGPDGPATGAPKAETAPAAKPEPAPAPARPAAAPRVVPRELKAGEAGLVPVAELKPSQMGVGRAQVEKVYSGIIDDARKKLQTDPAYRGLTDEQGIAKHVREWQEGVKTKKAVEAWVGPDGQVLVTDAHHRVSAIQLVIEKHLQGLAPDQLPQVKVRIAQNHAGKAPADFHMALARARKGQFSVEQRAGFRQRLDELRQQGHPDPEGAAHAELFKQLPGDFRGLGNDKMRSAMGNSLFSSGLESGLYYDYFEFKFYQHLAEKGITFDTLLKRAQGKGYRQRPGVPPEADPMVLWELRNEMLKPDVVNAVLTDAKRFRIQGSEGVSVAQARQQAAQTIQRFVDNAVQIRDLEAKLWKSGVSDYTLDAFRGGKKDLAAFRQAAAAEARQQGRSLSGDFDELATGWLDRLKKAGELKAALPKD